MGIHLGNVEGNSVKLLKFLKTATLVYYLYQAGAVRTIFCGIAAAKGGMINDLKETPPPDGMPIFCFGWACLNRAAVRPMFGTWGCH